jgi:hypothetical protein
VHDNCFRFGDYLITVNQVGQVDCRILRKQCRFDFVEPFGSAFGPIISLLCVGNLQVLKEQSDPLGKSSDCPISEHN